MGKGGWVMLLALGFAKEVFFVLIAGYVLGSLALVVPGVFASVRHLTILTLSVVGACFAGLVAWSGIVDVMRNDSAGAWEDRLDDIALIVVFFAISLTGCYGVWRWFKLPRR